MPPGEEAGPVLYSGRFTGGRDAPGDRRGVGMRGIDHQIKAFGLQQSSDLPDRQGSGRDGQVFALRQEGLAVFRGDAGRHAAGLRI